MQVELAGVRMSMTELEQDQLDLVILAQINAHHYAEEAVGHWTEAEKLQRVERVKDYTTFSKPQYLPQNVDSVESKTKSPGSDCPMRVRTQLPHSTGGRGLMAIVNNKPCPQAYTLRLTPSDSVCLLP